jgi:hypothetical protein
LHQVLNDGRQPAEDQHDRQASLLRHCNSRQESANGRGAPLFLDNVELVVPQDDAFAIAVRAQIAYLEKHVAQLIV